MSHFYDSSILISSSFKTSPDARGNYQSFFHGPLWLELFLLCSSMLAIKH